ncbi:MAG: AAA family ATPase [Candidatus Onthovivens sp.]|nr:AAA family ATPase [Candidatus Onthovivens sp.]
MFVGLSNESYKLICGKDDLYPIQNNEDLTGGMNVFSLRANNTANNTVACIELLKSLNDESLIEIYKSGKLDHSRCGGEATRIIDGKKDFFDLNTLSSGQQEILLKLKTLKQAQVATDFVLLDEPETSLHPRWQKRIVYLIRDIIADKDGNIPQLFVATHSEKVLESLISNDDALIIRLFKEEKVIKAETIRQMDLCLPTTTFAELDYVVFHISSLDYHDELFNYFQFLIDKNSTVAVDEKLQLYGTKVFKEEMKKYEKTRVYTVHNRPYTTNTLPTYIRDFFHHPNEIKVPSDDEIKLSISFLRIIIKYLIDRGFDNKEE